MRWRRVKSKSKCDCDSQGILKLGGSPDFKKLVEMVETVPVDPVEVPSLLSALFLMWHSLLLISRLQSKDPWYSTDQLNTPAKYLFEITFIVQVEEIFVV